MKKGIALLITILMLASISLLLIKNFSISERFIEDHTELKLLSIGNRLFLDSTVIVKKTLQDINSTEAYDFLFSMPFVFHQNSFKLTFTFSPIENRININNLLKNNQKQEEYALMIEKILISYNVQDPNYFIDLILDTLDNDTVERSYNSEIILKNRFFTNTEIQSIDHFDAIIDYYAQAKDDKNIYLINWNKFIGFSGNGIDINFASIELLRLLIDNPYLDKTFKNKYYEDYDELGLDEGKIAYLKKLNVMFSTTLFHVKVTFDDLIQNISFEYDYDKKNDTTKHIKYSF